MADQNELFADTLIRMTAQRLATDPSNAAYRNENYVRWLIREAAVSQTLTERHQTGALADAFAKRMNQKLTALRLGTRIPTHELRQKDAPVVLSVIEATSLARKYRCAPVIDMAVAAGEGRMLWDEPCDQWLELPERTPAGRYVALQVTGDSMSPFLESRDVILIKLDSVVAEDDVIVARPDDDGYVVKRVASVRKEELELASVNPDYARITMQRDMSRIIGVVIARFRRIPPSS